MIGRLLLWIVLGIAAWWMLRPRRRVEPPAAATRDRPAPAPAAPAEAMVDCAACGLHFPASEAIRDGTRLYCCSAHREAGPRRAP
jgi:uncharacterized protein